MKSRIALFLALGVFAVACSGDSGDAGAMADDAEPAATAEVDADAAVAAALEEFRAGYVQHYNLHHASMVADLYTDEALTLMANGEVNTGREAITASLENAMAGNPTLEVQTEEQMIFGDRAVVRGVYGIEMAPEGMDPGMTGGHYMSVFENVDGEWKLGMVITNHNAPPGDDAVMVPPPEDGPPPDLTEGPQVELAAAWAQHYNLGHPSMVADFHTDDGVTMWANQPMAEGRAAIEAGLAGAIETMSPQITIHPVNVEDLGDGWALHLGWYELTGTTPEGDVAQSGAYLNLTMTGDDGQPKIHWSLSHAAW
jgi:uncharacterized protein (TIGR02246 family)